MPVRPFLLTIMAAPAIFGSLTSYNVVTMPSLPAYAYAQSINDLDQIAGVYNPSNDGFTTVPFTATTSTFSAFSDPSGLVRTLWTSINDSGAVAGYGVTAADYAQAYFGSTALGWPSGYTGSITESLNNSGEAAGYLIKNGTFATYAGTFTSSSTSVLTSAVGDLFYGINNAGIATGTSAASRLIYGTASSVTMVALSGGFSTMTGYGINGSGHICGTGANGGNTVAFYFNGTTTTAIPLLAGFDVAQIGPQCISSANIVVGSNNSTLGVNAAFIWNAVDGTQLLSNDVLQSGWTFTQVAAMNSIGDILAFGTNGTYTGYVILEETPEPSTVWMAGAALLVLGLWRWLRV